MLPLLLLNICLSSLHIAQGESSHNFDQFLKKFSSFHQRPVKLLDLGVGITDTHVVFCLKLLDNQLYALTLFSDRGSICDDIPHLIIIPPFIDEDAKLSKLELCSSNIYLMPRLPSQLKPRLNDQVIIYTPRKNTTEIDLSETYYIKGKNSLLNTDTYLTHLPYRR